MATREYTKENLTVIWAADKCIHSRNCFNGLQSVFNPNERPWININGATVEEIKNQVDKCPSGALSYNNKEVNMSDNSTKIEPLENGPLMVYGEINLKTSSGEEKLDRKAVAFCRCGHSENKPYCDGSHKAKDFISRV